MELTQSKGIFTSFTSEQKPAVALKKRDASVSSCLPPGRESELGECNPVSTADCLCCVCTVAGIEGNLPPTSGLIGLLVGKCPNLQEFYSIGPFPG